MEKVDRDARPGRREGMGDRDRSPVHVRDGRIESEFLLDGHVLTRERFVHLNQVHIVTSGGVESLPEMPKEDVARELVRRAAPLLTTAQIAGLNRIDDVLNQAIAGGDITGYMMQNHRFHMTLYAASASQVLLPLVEALWLRAAPSLRVMCGRFGTRNLPDLHQQALAALARGDGTAAGVAIAGDIRQGMENVRAILREKI